MSPGKAFERDWQASVDRVPGVLGLRLRDAGGVHLCDPALQAQIAKRCPSLRFTVSNPFDYLMYADGRLWALELKSVAGSRWPFSSLRPNQEEGLLKAARTPGVSAGLVLNFRDAGLTVFLPISSFITYREQSGRKSLPWGVLEAPFAVTVFSALARTRTRYDVTRFIKESV